MDNKKLAFSDIPSDYPLPNLYYFSSKFLKEIRKQLVDTTSILNKNCFRQCHFPFLIPKSLLVYYNNLISLEDFIKVYSGKDKRSHAFLRPDGIFSQGITLAKEIIKSYKDLPLKLFEASSGYKKVKGKNKKNIFISPEESFSIQGGIFTENNDDKFIQSIISKIFKKYAISYTVKSDKSHKYGLINYITSIDGEVINLAKIYNFNQEVTQRANIYFFNKDGKRTFPYMYTFSLSQNIFLINILKNGRSKIKKNE